MGTVLIIQLRQLGDILLTTPVFANLRRSFPALRILALTHPMGQIILKNNPDIDHLYTHPVGELRSTWELLKQLRSEAIDWTLDFMGNPRSLMWTLASGAKETWAFNSHRAFLYGHKIPRPSSDLYIVRAKAQLLEAKWGLKLSTEQLIFPWSATDLGPTQNFFSAHASYKLAPFRILISPTHRRPSRLWSPVLTAELAAKLIDRYAAKVVWLWGPGEEEIAKACQNLCPRPTELAPSMSFAELAAFMAQADLFLGGSNGPSHLTRAVLLPSLEWHGPTDPRSWCPGGPWHKAIQAPHGDLQQLRLESVMKALEGFWPQVSLRAQRPMKSQLLRHYQECAYV